LRIAIKSVVEKKTLKNVNKAKEFQNEPLRNVQFVVIQKYTVVGETENVGLILNRPTLKHVMCLRKYKYSDTSANE